MRGGAGGAASIRRTWAMRWAGVGSLFAAVLVTPGQAQPGGGTADPSAGVASRGPDYARVQRIPDDVLDPSRRQAVILPSQPGEVGTGVGGMLQGTRRKLEPDRPLLPEGYIVSGRQARVRANGAWYEAELAATPDLPETPAIRILPNRRLELIKAVLADAAGASTLILTGRITEYRGQNYMLVEAVEEPVDPPAADVRPEPAAPPATRPASPDTPPSPEEIMQRLLQDQARRRVVLPDRASRVVTSQPAGEIDPTDPRSKALNWPEEAMLVDRVGRVLPGEEWYTFVFENQGRTADDKPVRLLPNRLLETAVSLAGEGRQANVFVISGEATLYEGANYLLLRKVLVRRDLGNLR